MKTGPEAILEMVAMNGEDGVTTKELILASGQRVTVSARRKMQARLDELVREGRLVGGQGWRPNIVGRPSPVPVYRPVKS